MPYIEGDAFFDIAYKNGAGGLFEENVYLTNSVLYRAFISDGCLLQRECSLIQIGYSWLTTVSL